MEKAKKKIAFVIGKMSSGGAQRVVATLVNNLVSDFDIILITYANQKSFYELDSNVQIRPCFKEERIKSSKNPIQSINLNYRLYKSIRTTLKNEKVQLVVGFITQSNIFSVLAAKKNGIPSVICERTNPDKASIQRIWRILRNRLYPKADVIVVQTEYAKNFYLRNIEESKIIILPNPINPTLSSKRTGDLRENIVLCVGRLHKLKDHTMAIKAFKKVKSTKWKLQILGEGRERTFLENFIGVQPNIELLGAKTNISDYYNKAKIFLFTSKYEGFPNALLEAMHYGLAPISTNCNSGPSEIIEDGSNGFLVNVGDHNAMAKRLEQMISDEDMISAMGEKAKKTTEMYSATHVTELWKKLIQSKLS